MTGILLPWLRRGLSNGIGGTDSRDGAPLALRGTITGTIELVDSTGATGSATTDLAMVGAGDVVGFDRGQVVRHEPPDGAFEVEANYFPFVELVAPDLPWMLTPARADADNALRPWLVLVCVEQRDGVTYDAAASPLPVLRVDDELVDVELPDLAESWAWAHVQSLVAGPQIESELAASSGAVFARMISPRRLLDGRTYRAALVPAFEVGRLGGLGLAHDGEVDLRPAWPSADPSGVLELPVYDSWTFTTAAAAGDFETLARRLEPDLDGGRLGYRPARVVDTGLLEPFEGNTRFEYAGALVTPETEPVGLERAARNWFRPGMTTRVEETAARAAVPRRAPSGYRPETDDPVIGPHLYGSWAAQVTELPDRGWLTSVNLDPHLRAAAGLGVEIVRRHQTELLAAAWDQAGDLIALRDELNRGRLAAEIGRSHQRRFTALDDADLLVVTGRQHVFSGPLLYTTAQRVDRSVIVPTAMMSTAYLRRTRPGSVLARRAALGPAVGRRCVDRFVAASAPIADRSDELEAVARFGSAFTPVGAITTATQWLTAGSIDVVGPRSLNADDPIPVYDVAPLDSLASDLTDTAAAVRESLDPMPTIVARLAARVSGVELAPDADLPTRVVIGARFPDPLFPWFHALGSELVLPGIEEFGNNRVRLLEVNESWIAAFLVGANHEWAREALWNEYPADLGATSFSTFWNRVPAGTTDLASDMHTWTPKSTLASHVGTSDGASTVLLVRGDLIRRHPDTEYFLVTPNAEGELVEPDDTIPPERITWPSFRGKLDRETGFVGFDVDPAVVRAEGRYVAIQEPDAGPRFGLDTSDPDHHGQVPSSWPDLSWGHMAADAAALDATNHVQLSELTWLDDVQIDGLTWARNSGHQAGITYQQPFRLLVAAHYLMPDTTELTGDES